MFLGACQYGELELGGRACDEGRQCPMGLACVAGHCRDGGASIEEEPKCAEGQRSSTAVVFVGRAEAMVPVCGGVVVGDLASDRLQFVDLAKAAVTSAVPLSVDPKRLAGDETAIWVASGRSATVTRATLRDERVSNLEAPGPVQALALVKGQPLVVFPEGAFVSRTHAALLDGSGAVVARTVVGQSAPVEVAVRVPNSETFVLGGGSPALVSVLARDGGVLEWVATRGFEGTFRGLALEGTRLALATGDDAGQRVSELDSRTLAPVGDWPVGGQPLALAMASTLVVADGTVLRAFELEARVEKWALPLPAVATCDPLTPRVLAFSRGNAHLLVLADCGRTVTRSVLFIVPVMQ